MHLWLLQWQRILTEVPSFVGVSGNCTCTSRSWVHPGEESQDHWRGRHM